MENSKVVHVHIYDGWNGEFDFYFGSISAIYATLPVEALGIKESSLREKLRKTELYRNTHCMVKRGNLKRSQQK